MITLKVNEIFYSLQGESCLVGLPTVFVRLTGCLLRCSYCDTKDAYEYGQDLTITNIIAEVEKYKTKYVTVTGGEPLLQENVYVLLKKLCDQDLHVSIETGGSQNIAKVDPRVVKIMDIKTPGSGMCDRNVLDNFQYLSAQDQVKFVICNHHDYLWAKEFMNTHNLCDICHVLFSPSWREMGKNILADWILKDKLKVRYQLQLHKLIWGDVSGK